MSTAPTSQSFALSYGRIKPLLVVMGLGPRHARVDLTPDVLEVRMGLAFHATIPRAWISNAKRTRDWPWAIGVHTNFAGRWLVNGSATNLVSFDVSPPATGHCMGLAAHIRVLGLSLEDPDAFLAALGPAGTAA